MRSISLVVIFWCFAGYSARFSNVTVFKCLGRIHDSGEVRVDVPGGFLSDGVGQGFRLVRKELTCKKGRFKVLLQPPHEGSGKHAVAKILKTDPKTKKYSVFEDSSVRIIRDSGYLKIGNEYFSPEEYCFDEIAETELSLFVCFPTCYGNLPCLQKCCGQDEVFDVRNNACRKYDVASVNTGLGLNDTDFDNGTDDSSAPVSTGKDAKMWSPYLFRRSVDNCVKRVSDYHRAQISVHYRQSMPSCDPSEQVLVPLRKIHNRAFQRFRVLWPTGGVIVRDKYGNWSEFSNGRYCVDGMVNFDRHSSGVFTGEFEDQLVITCKDELSPSIQKKTIPLKYAMMLVLALLILFVTVFVSLLLWDRQNVYDWTVTCEVASMFFLIIFVGIAHTIARKPEKSDFGSVKCVFIGAASHFFWLATFCWLFIINFEIWWNFRSLVQLRQSRKWFRFSMYQIVGWGIPFGIVCLGLLLDRTWGLQNEDLDCTNITPPNYGQLNCYVAKPAQGPYIFYPIGIILMFNLLFYLLTVCKMWGYHKKSSAIIQYRSRSQNNIIIFAKLFIVMGVSWVFEIFSWLSTPSEVDKIPLYWVIFDCVTLFQAVSIFVIFTYKKEVISRLYWKYPKLKVIWNLFLRLPFCTLLPNDRDRAASIRPQQHNVQVNKIPREQTNESPVGGDQIAFTAI